jgi:hypothetical protein
MTINRCKELFLVCGGPIVATDVPLTACVARIERVDTRAKTLGISRNRLILEALEEKVGARDEWAPELVHMLHSAEAPCGRALAPARRGGDTVRPRAVAEFASKARAGAPPRHAARGLGASRMERRGEPVLR